MGSDDITPIKIGTVTVGIIGLQETLKELASEMPQAPDDEAKKELLLRVAKKNYVSDKVREQYGRALLREYKKHLGQEMPGDEEPLGLVIKVLGQGCANCRALSQRIMEVLSELKLAADFEHVTDIKEIARYGATLSPALVFNGNIVAMGRVPSKDQLIEWLKKAEG